MTTEGSSSGAVTPQSFGSETVQLGGVYLIRAQGDIALDGAPRLEAVLDEALADEPSRIILDLEAVTFLDSSGLRVVVDAQEKARAAGSTLLIEGMSAAVERVLEITDLLQSLTRVDEPGSNP
jgi:anti-anti-sigma factor